MPIIAACVAVMSSCAVVPGTYENPGRAVEGMRSAWRDDDALRFAGALSQETLNEYFSTLLAGWSTVRGHFSFLGDNLDIIDVRDVDLARESQDAPTGYIRPDNAKPARRLRARVIFEGETFEEAFLFVYEIDAEPDNSADSDWIRVGEQWIARKDHPNAHRYRNVETPLAERSGWRLVFPYYPYQGNSPLARRVLAALEKNK